MNIERKAGRPSVPPERRRSVLVSTMVTEEEGARLRRLATERRMSLSQYARDVLLGFIEGEHAS